ncbi:MAG: UPF0149 family protein [Gammaproteobacteria bacterium]|nr:UPF0149 family protein [Gammaproteobacteria bacterium]
MALTYENLQEILENTGLPVSAAEAHGAVCGLLCAGNRSTDAILAVLGDVDEDDELRQALGTLQAKTHAQLEDGDFEFQLLMPADDVPAPQRSRALVDWCRGFVAGTGRQDKAARTDEAAEVLADIAAMADAAGTVGERDLNGLIEYLRVGVQLLYEESDPAGSGS